VQIQHQIGQPNPGQSIEHGRYRGPFLATNSTLCPRATRVAIRLAMVWLLPVPGGPDTTIDWPQPPR
jgi:hypothetical protein